MNSSLKSLFQTALAVVSVFAGPARADMGGVWVTEVTPDSITINWTEPAGIHLLDPAALESRICWALDTDYSNSYPKTTDDPARCVRVAGKSRRPFTISGLQPSTSYRIKVETLAAKRSQAGVFENPMFRQVALIKQRTRSEPPGRNLRIVSVAGDSITVEFVNAAPQDFAKIRIAYETKWSKEELNAVAGGALAPAGVWGTSSPERGWVDLLTAPVLRVTFPLLLPDQSYEIVAYGHDIGLPVGERLGSVTAETSGHKPITRWEAALAANEHQERLDGYGRRLRSARGLGVFDIVSQLFPELIECADHLQRDDHDDLRNDDLAALLFLISIRTDEFDRWQAYEAASEVGLPLQTYLEREVNPFIVEVCKEDIDPPPPLVFRRGDANSSGDVDISDSVRMFDHLFRGVRVFCRDAADSNDSGEVDISDPVHLLGHLFLGGPPPVAPFPGCGVDETGDSLGCEEFHNCEV